MLIANASFWPDQLLPFFSWMKDNNIGDATGVFGVVVSVIGFIVTIAQLVKSKRAAEAAAEAANEARKSVAYVTTLADFAAAIAILEEIKRFHRGGVLYPLPDRYATLRKLLIGVQAGRGDLVGDRGLSAPQKDVIQRALVNLSMAETTVESAIHHATKLDVPRINRILSKDLDQLEILLVHLKSIAGGRE